MQNAKFQAIDPPRPLNHYQLGQDQGWIRHNESCAKCNYDLLSHNACQNMTTLRRVLDTGDVLYRVTMPRTSGYLGPILFIPVEYRCTYNTQQCQ